jgi:hypothetical protein
MKEPFVAGFDCDPNVFSCPNFKGEKKIKGWELIDEHFVDKSGWGASDEPALTRLQFVKRIKEGHGYAITNEGQFQVYVGEYIKIV